MELSEEELYLPNNTGTHSKLLSCALSDVLKLQTGCTSFARTTSASCSRQHEAQALTRPQASA